MDNIKLKVVYEPYERFTDCGPRIGHITAPTFREAIIKMLSRVGMYLDEDVIMEKEEDMGREMTKEELIEALVNENGDGCDFIISLTNEVTGEVYIEGLEDYEEWSI